MKKSLLNARLFTGEETFEKGFVTFENGRITAAGPMENYRPGGEETEDCTGKWLYPGFVDPHCHLGMEEDSLGFPGDDVNEMTDPVTPHLSGLDAVNPTDRYFAEAAAAGVTTVITGPGSANPIGGQMIAIKTAGSPRVDELVLRAPVAMKMAFGENPKTVYHERKQAPMTRMATAAVIRQALEKCRRYMEKGGEYDPKMEALAPVLKGELPVHMHAHRRDDIFTALRIAKEYGLRCVIVHGTEGHLIARELQEAGARVFAGPILTDRSKPELVNLTPKGPGLLAKAGVPVALCTDSPVIPQQYLALCAGLCVREGMDPDSALAAITSTAADLCGLGDRVGRIAPGLDADLALFSANALSLEGVCLATYIGGQKVYEAAR